MEGGQSFALCLKQSLLTFFNVCIYNIVAELKKSESAESMDNCKPAAAELEPADADGLSGHISEQYRDLDYFELLSGK